MIGFAGLGSKPGQRPDNYMASFRLHYLSSEVYSTAAMKSENSAIIFKLTAQAQPPLA